MSHGARAYGAVAKQIASPRDLEADLLLKAAARLQAVRDAWDTNKSNLDDALLYNRKLWSIFLTSVTSDENPLPVEIRQNVANLGLFVMNHTQTAMLDRKPERLSSLININREIATGLRSRPVTEAAAK
jgi:flagellar protein FlaF